MSHGHRFMRARLLAAVPLVVGGAAMQLSATHTASAATTSGWHVVSSNVIPGLSGATRLSALPATQALQVGIALHDPNAAAEEAAAQAIYDPGSASFHHYMTPQQWQARFMLPQATYSAVASQLTSQGLSVAYVAPTLTYATLSGTVDQVQRTFGVDLGNYQAADGTRFFANAQAPTVPDGVDAIVGLNSFGVQHPKLPALQSTSQGVPCIQGYCTGLVSPQDLWSMYGQPSSNRGQGQKVAVIGEGDMSGAYNDLRSWETRMGNLPPVPVKEHAIANDQTDMSGQGEWDIDTQAETGMAPDALELDLYFAQSLGVASGAFSAYANDVNGPLQADASFGGCESLLLATGEIQTEQPILRQIAAEGRTMFVSTGDTGGSCAAGPVNVNGVGNTVVPQVEWPAASNWAVAVGGTVLYGSVGANPHRMLETAWLYSGGGISLTQPAQSWQIGVAPIPSRCVVDDTLAPQTTAPICRGLPDVAAMSGDILTNSYDITTAGSPSFGAGTSLSSPLWAGMWTRIQAASASGLGFAAPALYRKGSDPVADPRDFFDVSIGSNVQWPALPRSAVDPSGYDYVTGLGVPNVAALMQDLTGSQTPSNTGATIGGGGVSSDSTACTSPNGVLTQPDGNQFYPFAAASVTKTVATFDSTAQAMTVNFTVPKLSTGTKNELDFYWNFSYLGHPYQLDATYDPNLGNTFVLYDLGGSGVVYSLTGIGTTTSLSSALTGSYDFTNGVATITMSLATFNGAVHPTTLLAAGGVLTATTATSGYEYDGFGWIISNGNCSFTL